MSENGTVLVTFSEYEWRTTNKIKREHTENICVYITRAWYFCATFFLRLYLLRFTWIYHFIFGCPDSNIYSLSLGLFRILFFIVCRLSVVSVAHHHHPIIRLLGLCAFFSSFPLYKGRRNAFASKRDELTKSDNKCHDAIKPKKVYKNKFEWNFCCMLVGLNQFLLIGPTVDWTVNICVSPARR